MHGGPAAAMFVGAMSSEKLIVGEALRKFCREVEHGWFPARTVGCCHFCQFYTKWVAAEGEDAQTARIRASDARNPSACRFATVLCCGRTVASAARYGCCNGKKNRVT